MTSDFRPESRLIGAGVPVLAGVGGRSMVNLAGFEALATEGALLSDADVARETDRVIEAWRCPRG